MAIETPIDEMDKIDVITAVPLNSVKNRERGYNQAEMMLLLPVQHYRHVQ